ncbi:VOC family protein [Paludibacter sp.]|uniref:VOC family protein n=1 Tax=Paludibacter sp. TaxID=1898105 RepID=UPI00343CAF74
MKIHHIAIWVKDLENMRNFYLKYFDCQSGERYENPTKGFSSFFIRFDGRACLELMPAMIFRRIPAGMLSDGLIWRFRLAARLKLTA